ncbi:tetratricopeptide repeat protein [Candidatus Woesearchaeota archaeon]|nr:tetratricopeptide repeat protein [Candidatus Woesearchaeota archaeon]
MVKYFILYKFNHNLSQCLLKRWFVEVKLEMMEGERERKMDRYGGNKMSCCTTNNKAEFKKELEAIVEENDTLCKNLGPGAIDPLEELLERQSKLEIIDHYGCPLLKPVKVSLLYNLSCAYERTPGSLDQALKMYQKVLALDPQHDKAWYNLGTNFIKLGKYDEAKKNLKQATKLKPYDADYARNYNHVRRVLAGDGRLRLEDALRYRTVK